MVDSTGFISEQRHNRRASVIILAGTFLLLFVVANLVAGVLGAYSSQDCKAVSAGGSLNRGLRAISAWLAGRWDR